MSDAELRVGVLGCADFARRRMLPAMMAAPGAEVVAVASRDAAKAVETARLYGCRPVTGYAELLALEEVEAVYAPLPAALHARWVEAALRAGKHVLAEKPLTTDPARTAELLALARELGLVLMENVMFVHHGQHEAVRTALAEGAIGELRAMHAAFAIPRLQDTDIRYNPDLGGGALWDVGVYPVRAALHFLGPALRVAGAVLTRGEGRRVDTSGAAVLHTPEGVTVQLTFGLDHPYVAMYELWGTEGRLSVERAYTPPADFEPRVRLRRADGDEELRVAPDDQVANTLAAFVRAVRDAQGGREVRDGRAAVLRQAELLHDIREAARA
ncbi:Gfo/Idh/MocA family oxidoreductase [Streptomyces sp. ME19-01-6]|uniref:Gfo/Idh/MocA family protein n=1 Tax=Streptomyces sp. ME19-01-6 TaxID=3028686 RepID=UPI0029A8B555|nr:Gfo/Idh/MocA family oxidoreductase [Streptomyces sp. ME19-01-6]MDX3229787.1 Gfo/Idh/MocA family oxidoreductase [Streptomyces sp. ME19-01-6]